MSETGLGTFAGQVYTWDGTKKVWALPGLLGPVNTIALGAVGSGRLIDINTTTVPDGTMVFVRSIEQWCVFDATGTVASDNITVATPLVGPGRWYRVPGGSIRWLKQTAWFLDPAGSDENAGDTALVPIATLAELSRRFQGMADMGIQVTVNTLVTLAAGSYGKTTLDLDVASGVNFRIQGAFTSTAATPVDAFVTSVPSTNTRGRMDRAAFVFTDPSRVRLTSGTQSAARAYVTGLPAAGQAYVTRWWQYDPAVNTNPTIVNPAVASDFVVDTLTSTIGQQDVRNRGAGRIIVSDCIIESTPAHRATNDSGALNGVIYNSCQFQTSSCKWYDGSVVKFVGCDFRVVAILVNGTYAIRSSRFGQGLVVDSGGYANISESCSFDGVSPTPDFVGLNVTHTGFVLFTASTGGPDSAQWVDIPSTRTGVRIDEMASISADKTEARCWGADNAATNTCDVRSSGRWTWVANSKPNIPGGTNDVRIAANTMTYAALGTGFIAASQGYMMERTP